MIVIRAMFGFTLPLNAGAMFSETRVLEASTASITVSTEPHLFSTLHQKYEPCTHKHELTASGSFMSGRTGRGFPSHTMSESVQSKV